MGYDGVHHREEEIGMRKAILKGSGWDKKGNTVDGIRWGAPQGGGDWNEEGYTEG